MTSLGGSARAMAVGTVASRGTGFLRTAVIASVLGVEAVGTAYNVANTAPNIVYELLLGGVLTSIVVPLLVRAAKEDEDGGEAYAQRLLTLVVIVLGGASLLLIAGAPLLIDLYTSDDLDPESRELAIVFARFFLPQVLFYGAGAVLGAVLNTRNRYAAPMWAPVLNNLVVIATGLTFLVLRGSGELTPGSLTTGQVALLGIGTTLGIVAQTIALIPSLRAAGFSLRLRRDLRGVGLSKVGSLAKWVLIYVVANQAAYLVVVRLSSSDELVAMGRGYASYVYAFVLWQLPHAIVAVSVITALLPRMSRAAADERTDDLRGTLNRGLRLTISVLVPAAAGFLVLGRELATLVFARGEISTEEARYIGLLLGVFALGLVPFSTYQLQLRAFYAMQDTRTPTLINLGVNATLVAVGVTLYSVLPTDLKVAGLAAGHATSFLGGLVLCSFVLSRRIGGLDVSRVVQTAVRCLVAVLVPALLALGIAEVCGRLVGDGPLGAGVALVLGGAVLVAGYLLLTRRMRVREVDEVVGPVLRRLGLSRG